MDRIQSENLILKGRIEKLELIAKFAGEIGISNWCTEDRIKDRLRDFKSKVPPEYLQRLREMKSETDNLLKLLEA